MNNLEQFSHKLCSKHSLLTSFVHFNQTHDKFLTCGQEGQINVYSLEQNGEIKRLSYANLFNQVVVAVKWANFNVGGAVAVAGSLGKLLILKITPQTIITQKCFEFQNEVVHSIDWSSLGVCLLVGTTKGNVYVVDQSKQEWISKKHTTIGDSPIIVAFGAHSNNAYFCSSENNLYIDEFQKQKQKKEEKLLIKLGQEQRILSVLVRTQCLTGLCQLFILTHSKIHLYEYQYEKKIKQILVKNSIQLVQQIKLNEKDYNWMSWGWTQSELVLYSTSLSSNKQQTQNKAVRSPIVFVRKLNRKFVRKND